MPPSALNLSLPETNGHVDDIPFAMDKSSVQHWVSTLPLANTGETVKKLYQALTAMNRCQLSANELIDALELLHEPVEYVMKALHKHFVNAPHPLSQRGRQVANLTSEIYSEMAIGYKHVINGASLNIVASLSSPLLMTGLQRALYYLNKLMVTNYQAYTMPSKGIWNEIHQLYLYAEKNSIHHTKIENNLDKGISKFTTIADTYKNILLISIANPYRLDGEKIRKLSLAMETYAPICNLTQRAEQNRDLYQFIVDLTQDKEPIPLNAYKEEVSENCRIIITSKMVAQLKKELNNSSIESNHGLPSGFFKSLLPIWENTRKRKSLRTRRQSETEIAIGLTATHKKLDGSTSNSSENIFITEDPDEKSPTLLIDDDQGSSDSQYNIQPCTIVNRSAKGYGLVWKGDNKELLRVGELVSVKEARKNKIDKNNDAVRVGELISIKDPDESDEVWRICLVRWIQNIESGMLRFGVELLSQEAQSVKAKNFDKHNKSSAAKLECLLIPADPKLNIPPSIITPGLFRTQQLLSIDMPSGNHIISLTRLLCSKASFRQFSYAIADEDGNVSSHTHPNEAKLQEDLRKKTAPATKKDDPFGSIWSSL